MSSAEPPTMGEAEPRADADRAEPANNAPSGGAIAVAFCGALAGLGVSTGYLDAWTSGRGAGILVPVGALAWGTVFVAAVMMLVAFARRSRTGGRLVAALGGTIWVGILVEIVEIVRVAVRARAWDGGPARAIRGGLNGLAPALVAGLLAALAWWLWRRPDDAEDRTPTE